jgi:transposase
MLLQRHLVDHDAKQSLYLHKLNRTKKTMAFLRQLNQAPNIYYSFLFECVRRKQYSNIFNQVCCLFFDIKIKYSSLVFGNNSSRIKESL